ncbi:hypothetical protein [Burkholderia anthina]|uniref:hypothetical protein n=1 Tax=Burkholderia anthina TaxID=179879 RepID=UPI00158CBA7C|nr:hypothetical protein [Burkholderia anthina]
MESHNHARLIASLLPDSVAKTWAAAQYEWELHKIQILRDFDAETGEMVTHGTSVCRCGHEPIVELCILKNKENGNEAVVGNVCVKKFLGIDNGELFQGVKRIQKNINAAPNRSIIHYAWDRKLIPSEHELAVLQRSTRIDFAKLNDYQRAKRVTFNRMILAHFAGKEKAATSAA